MTRIRFKVVLLLQVALAGLATAELETYQEVEPQLEQRHNLDRLVHFLEEVQQQKHQHEVQLHRQQERNLQQHLRELAERQEEEQERGYFREDLPEERPNIIDVLQRGASNPFEYVQELEQAQKQRLQPFMEYDPSRRLNPLSFEDEARARFMQPPVPKDPMLDYPEPQYADLERVRQMESAARRAQEAQQRHRPEFTYAFPPAEPMMEGAPPPFAVRPNDPRYYEEDKSADQREAVDSGETSDEDRNPSREEIVRVATTTTTSTTRRPTTTKSRKPAAHHLESSMVKERVPESGLMQVNVLPEPRRRAEMDPLFVPIGRKVNDDIYFIAIVAGCSAAAMFALVLVSLTWCRIQRVSKAAADVEYPAYGVTGPNKDISPSGDQRLAQSAQMYHFQHQKQQIIAMEKASAVRDHGSVSEAESDEENEEGDYTVYECPGLAPTGEMEVKNPLFHDETPSTPKSRSDDM